MVVRVNSFKVRNDELFGIGQEFVNRGRKVLAKMEVAGFHRITNETLAACRMMVLGERSRAENYVTLMNRDIEWGYIGEMVALMRQRQFVLLKLIYPIFGDFKLFAYRRGDSELWDMASEVSMDSGGFMSDLEGMTQVRDWFGEKMLMGTGEMYEETAVQYDLMEAVVDFMAYAQRSSVKVQDIYDEMIGVRSKRGAGKERVRSVEGLKERFGSVVNVMLSVSDN